MATQDDWPTGPGDESSPRDPWAEGEPRKRGTSTGTKVLIVVLAIGGIAVLLCCGVFFWAWSSIDMEVQETPAAAVETTNEIAEIEIPPAFEPKRAMRMEIAGVTMEVAEHRTEADQGLLLLGEMRGVPPGEPRPEREMRRVLEQLEDQRELQVNRSEVREFEIRGETVRFTFAEAVDEAGNEFRTVEGTFPTEDGAGILSLQVPEEAYDEQAVVEMIESIR